MRFIFRWVMIEQCVMSNYVFLQRNAGCMCIVLAAKSASRRVEANQFCRKTSRDDTIRTNKSVDKHQPSFLPFLGLNSKSKSNTVGSHHTIVTSRSINMPLTLARPLEVQCFPNRQIDLFDSSFNHMALLISLRTGPPTHSARSESI